MNPEDLAALVSTGNWIAVGAVVLNLLVALLKSPTLKGPLSRIPVEVRPWVALVLGALQGVVMKVIEGLSWKSALVAGLLSAMLAIVGHDTITETGQAIGRKMNVKPPTLPLFMVWVALVFGTFGGLLGACSSGGKACQIIDATASALQSACVVVKYVTPDGQPAEVAVHPSELQAFGHAMAVKRALAAPGSASASASGAPLPATSR